MIPKSVANDEVPAAVENVMKEMPYDTDEDDEISNIEELPPAEEPIHDIENFGAANMLNNEASKDPDDDLVIDDVPVIEDGVMYCKTRRCPGKWVREKYPEICLVLCTHCAKFNCFGCNVIHVNQSCREYRNENKPLEIKLGFDKVGEQSQTKIRTILQANENENAPLLKNKVKFDCIICYMEYLPNEGVRLRNCAHQFCEECLQNHIKHSQTAEIQCPFSEGNETCSNVLLHREIRALSTPEVYEQFLSRSVQQAQIRNLFHCRSENCKGVWVYEDNDNMVSCPLCNKFNCHPCKAIHERQSCRDYQYEIFSKTDPGSIATRKLFEEMILNGEAMHCPHCDIILTRNEGCDWIQCQCSMEICWATKGPRWGPKGKGDTSGGCKCGGTKGPKCHPTCNYCH